MADSPIPLAATQTASARETCEQFVDAVMDDFDERWITGHGTGDLSRGFAQRDQPSTQGADITRPITTGDVPEALRGPRSKP